MKFLLITLLICVNVFAYKDFGTEGHLYEIKEKDIMKEIEKEVKDYQAKMNPDEMKRQIEREINKQAFYSSKLPLCEKDSTEKMPNYQYYQQDIINPAGRVIKKAGDSFIYRSPKQWNVCFINAKNKIEMINQINYYDKLVKEISGGNEECVYMISDRNVLELNKEFEPRSFYPSTEAYEKRFGVKCYPAMIHIEDDMKYNYEMSMEHFKHSEVKK